MQDGKVRCLCKSLLWDSAQDTGVEKDKVYQFGLSRSSCSRGFIYSTYTVHTQYTLLSGTGALPDNLWHSLKLWLPGGTFPESGFSVCVSASAPERTSVLKGLSLRKCWLSSQWPRGFLANHFSSSIRYGDVQAAILRHRIAQPRNLENRNLENVDWQHRTTPANRHKAGSHESSVEANRKSFHFQEREKVRKRQCPKAGKAGEL